ncbi:MAG: hypothetical protein AMXMBFR7_16230 [Planctomycetota bacterium]
MSAERLQELAFERVKLEAQLAEYEEAAAASDAKAEDLRKQRVRTGKGAPKEEAAAEKECFEARRDAEALRLVLLEIDEQMRDAEKIARAALSAPLDAADQADEAERQALLGELAAHVAGAIRAFAALRGGMLDPREGHSPHDVIQRLCGPAMGLPRLAQDLVAHPALAAALGSEPLPVQVDFLERTRARNPERSALRKRDLIAEALGAARAALNPAPEVQTEPQPEAEVEAVAPAAE